MYYYHSHSHGEANWQLYNGMAGAIVVNGTSSFAPQTSGLPERVIVLANVLAHPQYSSLASAHRAALQRVRESQSIRAQSDTDGTCSQPFGIDGEYTLINGRPAGTSLAMQPGLRQLWRVVNASADGYYDLSVDGQALHVVSIDGVPLKAYPGAQERDVPDVVVPPAGRVEFIVTGPRTSSAFRTTCFDTGPNGDPNPSQVLAMIHPALSPQLATIPLPGPTAPALGTFESPVGGAIAQQRTLDFSEDTTGTNFYLNGARFSFANAPMFVARSGTVERWTIRNFTREVHAFHIHQIHFITQDVDGVAQPPAWRDTLNLPIAHADGTPSASHVLLDFRDPIIKGTFLFHCHLLQHEDDGMMAEIKVQ